MLDTIHATRFVRPMESGRTFPNLVECERDDGTYVEAIVKCSAKTMQGCHDLAIEAICGMLARDLNLPIPEFFAVVLSPEFIEGVDDPVRRDILEKSDPYAFGSKALPGGFSIWGKDQPVPVELCQTAAEIFTFDAIVVNGDRRPGNPNCLFSGSELAIIDHELCFSHELFWKEPWLPGGFSSRCKPEDHIFAKPRLAECPKNLDRFEAAWANIETTRIDEYFYALPVSWSLDDRERERVKMLILNAKIYAHEIVLQSLGALK